MCVFWQLKSYEQFIFMKQWRNTVSEEKSQSWFLRNACSEKKKKGEKLSEVHVGEKCICHLSCHHPRLKSTFPRFLPSSFIIILLSSHTFTFSWIWIPILCHLFLSSSSTHHLTFCSTRKEQKLLHYPISFHLDLANLLLLVIFRSENIILYLILQV